MRRALPLLLILALVGCKGSREKELIGTWRSGAGSVNIKEDKTFSAMTGPMTLGGTWSMQGDDITMVQSSINGISLDQFKPLLQSQLATMSPTKKAQAEGFLKNLDKANILTLSADGKTLTTNKEKDKNSGPSMTLTKG